MLTGKEIDLMIMLFGQSQKISALKLIALYVLANQSLVCLNTERPNLAKSCGKPIHNFP
jgi:hypothetical protein